MYPSYGHSVRSWDCDDVGDGGMVIEKLGDGWVVGDSNGD